MPASSGSLKDAAEILRKEVLIGGGEAILERAGRGEVSMPSGEYRGGRGRSLAIASLNCERTSTVARPATESGTCDVVVVVEEEEETLAVFEEDDDDVCRGREGGRRGEIIDEALVSNTCSCCFCLEYAVSSSLS